MILHDLSLDSHITQPISVLANGWPAAWIAEDSDADATSPDAVHVAAQAYIASGLSCIPIDAYEADKAPDSRRLPSWKVYQLRRPRPDELLAWHELVGPYGLAVLGGAVSGGQRGCGLEVIDFDTIEPAALWIEPVESQAPGLMARLVRVQSPRPGMHVYYRCPVFGECQKLACAGVTDGAGGTNERPKKVTLLELKGEGGYCLVPPSPRRCQPSAPCRTHGSTPPAVDASASDRQQLTHLPGHTPAHPSRRPSAHPSLRASAHSPPRLSRHSLRTPRHDTLLSPADMPSLGRFGNAPKAELYRMSAWVPTHRPAIKPRHARKARTAVFAGFGDPAHITAGTLSLS